jgi:hypothetical protein
MCVLGHFSTQKLDLEAGKSSQRRPRIWSWLRPPFDLADIPVRARGMRILSVAGSNLLRSGHSLIVAQLFGVYHAPWSLDYLRNPRYFYRRGCEPVHSVVENQPLKVKRLWKASVNFIVPV